MARVPYEKLWIHRLMLLDLVRCEAYRRALTQVVDSHSAVLDVGAGSGILSFFAAQAGARMVFAVERTPIAQLARELIEKNHLQDRIQVYQCNVEEAELPNKVDVLVSEWLGPFGVDENFLPSVVVARDRWLKPGGKILPERVTAWIAPIWDPLLDSDLFFWLSRPYGLDLSPIAHYTAEELRYRQDHILKENLLAEPAAMWVTDLNQCRVKEAHGPFQASVNFTFAKESRMNGLGLWFSAEFPGGTLLSCAPDAPRTHWGRTVCPLERVLILQAGAQIQVQFTCEPGTVPGTTISTWSIAVNDHL